MFRHLDHLVESTSNVTRICDSIYLALYLEDLLSCFESTEQSFLNIWRKCKERYGIPLSRFLMMSSLLKIEVRLLGQEPVRLYQKGE